MKVQVKYKRRGKPTRVWKQKLLTNTDDIIISSFEFRLKEPFSPFDDRVLIRSGYHGVLFELMDEWYNVVKIFDEDKRLKGYYSDIRTPPDKTKNGYIAEDRFLDYWVDLDGSYILLDEDEFKEADLPRQLEDKALRTAKRLKKMIKNDDYPPDPIEKFHLSQDDFEDPDYKR